MRQFSLFVAGKPLSQQRPRTYQQGGKTRTISLTGANRQWRDKVRLNAKHEWLRRQDREPLKEVECELLFVFPIKDKKLWGLPHTSRPDIDNLAKLVMDAIQPEKGDPVWRGIVEDDNQIWKLSVRKVYGDKEGVHITITET